MIQAKLQNSFIIVAIAYHVEDLAEGEDAFRPGRAAGMPSSPTRSSYRLMFLMTRIHIPSFAI